MKAKTLHPMELRMRYASTIFKVGHAREIWFEGIKLAKTGRCVPFYYNKERHELK